MKRILISLVTLLLLTGAVTVSYSVERQPILWSIRSLGMGGTGIVNANTDDAFMFNPACAAYIPDMKLTDNFMSMGMDQTIISEAQYIITDLLQEITGLQNISNMSDTMKAWINKEHNIGFDPGMNMTFVSPLKLKDYSMGMGLGVYGNALVNMGIGQGVWSPTLDLKVTADAIGMGGVAFDIYSPIEALNPITVGISAKYLYRVKVDRYESVLSLLMQSTSDENFFSNYFSDILQKGGGVGFDMGFIYKWNDGDVGLGLTINNIGGLKLNYASGAETIPMAVNLGWGCNYGNWILACDINDILTSGDFFKKVHIGAEYPLGMLDLRGGLSSGWPTLGARLTLNLLLFRMYIEYAYTATELGTYAGQWGNYYHRASLTTQFF